MNISIIGLDCIGCGGCKNICTHKAISFLPNDEGFYYPLVDTVLCIDCGLCYSHCPQTQPKEELGHERILQFSYNAFSRLKKFYKRSASGGVFVTLAYSFFHIYINDAIVCGATFCDGYVHHIIINAVEDLPRLQGSKYVQSQLDDVYPKINKHLKQGGHVLFSGTPCQVAGLYSYLGNKHLENLFTIDIICHGVSSPGFFEKNLTSYGVDLNNLEDVQFRHKHPFYKSSSQFCLTMKLKNRGRTLLPLKKRRIVFLSHDPYFSLFSKGWTLRRSCYQCRYSNLNRVGDITIGDCDSHVNYPHFHSNEATSAVLINTNIGQEMWNESKTLFDYISLDIQKEADINHQLKYSFVYPTERDKIFKILNNLSVNQIHKAYAKPNDLRYYFAKLLLFIVPQRMMSKFYNYIK